MNTVLNVYRILWVSLQIESIWEDCFCDFEIRKALADLPNGLDETYDRCMEKITTRSSEFASTILRWICAAVTPFTVQQLREAWAIHENNGRLSLDLMPSKQDVLRNCSNLITRNSDDHVLLAHHSVLQFLLARPNGCRLFQSSFSLMSAKLELGELCIAHLTSEDYGLAMQYFRKGPTLYLERSVNARLTDAIPSWMRFALPKPRSMRITVPIPSRSTPEFVELPSFFHFARNQWAPLTSQLKSNSKYWEKFRSLALQQDLTWRMHPWEPLGQSVDSHYLGLLGWAIANRHCTFMDVLVHAGTLKMRNDIYNLPLYYHGNLLPLHLAARTNDADILSYLLPNCDPEKKDHDGWTAIHHAASVGADISVALLLNSKSNRKAQDRQGKSALHLAAGNGHLKIVTDLLQNIFKADPKNEDGRTPLSWAAENGHKAVVRLLVEQKDVDADSRDGNGGTPLSWAVRYGHGAVVRILRRKRS